MHVSVPRTSECKGINRLDQPLAFQSPSCDVHSCAGLKKIVQKQYGSAFEISVTHKGSFQERARYGTRSSEQESVIHDLAKWHSTYYVTTWSIASRVQSAWAFAR